MRFMTPWIPRPNTKSDYYRAEIVGNKFIHLADLNRDGKLWYGDIYISDNFNDDNAFRHFKTKGKIQARLDARLKGLGFFEVSDRLKNLL